MAADAPHSRPELPPTIASWHRLTTGWPPETPAPGPTARHQSATTSPGYRPPTSVSARWICSSTKTSRTQPPEPGRGQLWTPCLRRCVSRLAELSARPPDIAALDRRRRILGSSARRRRL